MVGPHPLSPRDDGPASVPGTPGQWEAKHVCSRLVCEDRAHRASGRLAGLGSEQCPVRRLRAPLATLTSHVLNGAVKHEVEERIKPFQDSTGL